MACPPSQHTRHRIARKNFVLGLTPIAVWSPIDVAMSPFPFPRRFRMAIDAESGGFWERATGFVTVWIVRWR